MNRITIDCTLIHTQADLHAALAQALDFPAWYGGNLDALHDLLTAITAETALMLRDWPEAEAALGPYGSRVEKVLAVSALENPSLTIEFC